MTSVGLTTVSKPSIGPFMNVLEGMELDLREALMP
jgi:hypothetical protein